MYRQVPLIADSAPITDRRRTARKLFLYTQNSAQRFQGNNWHSWSTNRRGEMYFQSSLLRSKINVPEIGKSVTALALSNTAALTRKFL